MLNRLRFGVGVVLLSRPFGLQLTLYHTWTHYEPDADHRNERQEDCLPDAEW